MEQLIAELNRSNIVCKTAVPMGDYTTFKVGGCADLAVFPTTAKELATAVQHCRRFDLPFYIVGKGSNLLVRDGGIRGAVILTVQMNDVHLKEDGLVYADCGAVLSTLCTFALSSELSGLEFAYGIPGTVGGGVFMNAGAYGGELCDVIERVYYLDGDGKLCSHTATEAEFGYRTSRYHRESDLIIVGADFKLMHGKKEEISATMQDIMGRRRDKQPIQLPSAGSTFKRPEGAYAAALIDECGFKGVCVGDACVSEKHAGFVVNMGNATADDILTLCNMIKEKVYTEKGYRLELEVRVLGD